MTVSSTTNRVSYTGNGVTTAFAFGYLFLANSDLKVVLVTTADGTETVQVLDTDYTVTGAGSGSGGTVTFSSAPASTKTVVIYRDPALIQPVDLVENDPLPAATLETAYDRAALVAQRLSDRIGRTIRQPEGDTTNIGALPAKTDRASKYLAFDVNGEPVVTAGTTSDVIVSAFVETLLDDANAAAVRATLELGDAAAGYIGVDVQAYDPDTLKADVADNLEKGFTATAYNAGTKSTGTFTPDAANGNFQYAVNGGAHTLAPPTGGVTMIVQYTNNAFAGAVTTSGFTKVTGDTISTANGDDFLFFITVVNGFSHLHVQAMQ